MLLGTLYSKGIPLFVSARFDFAITGILLGFLLLMQFLNLILYVPRVSSLGLHEKKNVQRREPYWQQTRNKTNNDFLHGYSITEL